MSSTKIEKDGIQALGNFLSESEILDPYINTGDKEPSWDGNIYVYKQPNHNDQKELIKGRIPVQVKSQKRKEKDKKSYQIEKSDLKNYLNDGGIIFIKVIYLTVLDYNIYARILLPVTLKELLIEIAQNDTDSISVKLKKIENIQSFENKCYLFLKNRPLQMNIENIADLSSLNDENTHIIAYTPLKDNIADSLFSQDSFYYLETKDNLVVPLIDFIPSSLIFNREEDISIDNNIYFNKISVVKEKDGSQYIELNTALRFIFSDDSLELELKPNDDALFMDYLNALRFFSKLEEKKSFYMGKSEIKLEPSMSFNLSDNDGLKLYEEIYKIFEMFRLNYNDIKMKEVYDNEKLIIRLKNTFFVSNKSSIKNATLKTYIEKLILINKQILLFHIHDKDDIFDTYNFFQDSIYKYETRISPPGDTDKENAVPCSNFIVLAYYDRLKSIDGYFEEVTEDLINKYDKRLFYIYMNFILDCIKAYDETDNIGYLHTAEKINNHIKNTDNDIFIINKMQIIKRQRDLTKDEKKTLVDIKRNPDNIDDLPKLCCINLLLDSIEEFEIDFEQLPREKQEEFKKWPIWNLYKKEDNPIE